MVHDAISNTRIYKYMIYSFNIIDTVTKFHFRTGESPYSVIAKVLDCDLEVSEFELQYHY